MLTTLIKLGLSEKEAKVYLAALELAQDTAQNIAKKAGVNRPTTYVILEHLMQMGLISKVEKGKKTLFIAEDPRELENILDKQKREIDDKKQDLKEIMGELKALNNTNQEKPIVKYFEGEDGLITLDKYGLEKIDKKVGTISIQPIDLIEKYFPHRRKSAVGERIKHKLKSRIIYTRSEPFTKAQNEQEMREGIYFPREKFPIDTTFAVYPGLGVKIFYFGESKKYGILIEDKNLARNMQLIMELALKGAKHSLKE